MGPTRSKDRNMVVVFEQGNLVEGMCVLPKVGPPFFIFYCSDDILLESDLYHFLL